MPDGPLSAPASNGDEVYAGSARGHIYAFPATCGDPICVPLWRGNAGSGPVSAPGVNDDFVYVASTSLYAFPARCGAADLACPPAWTGTIPGRADEGPPAVGAGLVVVGWHAEDRGGVSAFPAVCLDACSPVWTAATRGPTTSVTLSSDTAYVVTGGAVMAFPLSCRGVCDASWSGPFLVGLPYGVGAPEAPTLDHDRLYVGGADGRLLGVPGLMRHGHLRVARVLPAGRHPPSTPIARNGVVYVASVDGTLTAILESCTDTGAGTGACEDPWVDTLGKTVATGAGLLRRRPLHRRRRGHRACVRDPAQLAPSCRAGGTLVP